MAKKNKRDNVDFMSSLKEMAKQREEKKNADAIASPTNESKPNVSQSEAQPQKDSQPQKIAQPPKNIQSAKKSGPAGKGGKKPAVSIDQLKKMVAENEAKKKEEEEKKLKEKEEQERMKAEKARLESEKLEQQRKVALEAEAERARQSIKNITLDNKIIGKSQAEPVVLKKEATKKHFTSWMESTSNDFKSPICCILGHVDTGKTKILDKLRETDVQGDEAGGITQQIGATFFPADELEKKCGKSATTNIPGILIIDTPGHESFANLRARGSSICNLAILIVDIVHGLEPQTLESIELLKSRRTPFIIALNKIDRLYQWKSHPWADFNTTIKDQAKSTLKEYKSRLENTILEFSKIGLNTKLFNENTDPRKFISIVPTSAITGEGIPDLISLIMELSEKFLSSKIKIKEELECTVLEVKTIEGIGTTLDVILSNGSLKEGDKIAICGFNGPIVTTVKSLLVPQPLKELRVKSQYIPLKRVRASIGIKIAANGLEKAISGSRVMKIEGNEDKVIKALENDLNEVMSSIEISKVGIHVVASTLGSLEALATFLKASNIPISGVSVGTIKKKDLIVVGSMAEKNRMYGVILCFDVELDREIKTLASSMGVRIYESKIIYHLLDNYNIFVEEQKEKAKNAHMSEVVFPAILSIVPKCIFNARSPLVIGVCVEEGVLKKDTPLCVVKEGEETKLGVVTSIELNKNDVKEAKVGQKVAIKIEYKDGAPRMFGRHFEENDVLYSRITRRSIDILKEYYKDEMDENVMKTIVKLKAKFDII